MPSKKRKYNARFPAGRIKKIMQTDEEVGKVAQAVPIIISPRTLELFVESLLSKAMQVTMSRNARTLSPSHVKQCILSEARFDFLRDLVKNIPDVSAAEEKEMVSAESSPNSSRYSDASVPPRRIAREDSNSSSSCDIKAPISQLSRTVSSELDLPNRPQRTATVTAPIPQNEQIIDLSLKPETPKPTLTPNFYQETLLTDDPQHRSVITVNPTYTCQPSTSNYNLATLEPVQRIELPVPNEKLMFLQNNNNQIPQLPPPKPPTTPILNIDFSKNIRIPEFKLIDTPAVPPKVAKSKSLQRQNSKHKDQMKQLDTKPVHNDHGAGDLQIDEDYDT